MAYDKVVDSAKLNAALTATANAIRAKSGGTGKITWNESSGFADDVNALPEAGGGLSEFGGYPCETGTCIMSNTCTIPHSLGTLAGVIMMGQDSTQKYVTLIVPNYMNITVRGDGTERGMNSSVSSKGSWITENNTNSVTIKTTINFGNIEQSYILLGA